MSNSRIRNLSTLVTTMDSTYQDTSIELYAGGVDETFGRTQVRPPGLKRQSLRFRGGIVLPFLVLWRRFEGWFHSTPCSLNSKKCLRILNNLFGTKFLYMSLMIHEPHFVHHSESLEAILK